MNHAEIYRAFEGKWIYSGNEYFVAKRSALAFVRHLFQSNVRLLGIDGFILGADLKQPIMEAIADYSSGPVSESEVLEFLEAGMPSVTHFNFVLEAQ